MVSMPTLPTPQVQWPANDKLKGSFNSWFWGSIAVAAVLHFVVLAFWPSISVARMGTPAEPMIIEPLTEQRLPPPPQDIPPPRVPIMTPNLALDPDFTIPAPDFRAPIDAPVAPPTPQTDVGENPIFTPRTVDPRMPDAQRRELERFLSRNYPATLRDAGIGARAVLWVFIDETGVVRNTRMVESSGYPAFDQVAQDAIRSIRFTPAMNRDQRVPVWVQIPITWQVR